MPFVLAQCLFPPPKFHSITHSPKELVCILQHIYLKQHFHCEILVLSVELVSLLSEFSHIFYHEFCIVLFYWLHCFLTLLQTSWKHGPWFLHACISIVWQHTGNMIGLLHNMYHVSFHEIHIKNIHEVFPYFFQTHGFGIFYFKRNIIESDSKYSSLTEKQ